MNGYYGQHFEPDDLQGMGRAGDGSNNISMMGQGGMNSSGMLGGQSLDDIVNQNLKEIRRSSVPVHYGGSQSNMGPDMRRLSVMEFNGASSGGDLNSYQFDPSTVPGGMMPARTSNPNTSAPLSNRRQSTSNVALNDQFTGQSSPYMPNPGSAYQSPMHASIADSFMSPGLQMQSDYSNMNSMMSGGITPMDVYSTDQFASPMGTSPMSQKVATSAQGSLQKDPGNGASATTPRENRGSTEKRKSVEISRDSSRSQSFDQMRANSTQQNVPQQQSQNQASSQILANQTQFQHPQNRQNPQTANVASSGKFPWADPPGEFRMMKFNLFFRSTNQVPI